MFETCFHSPRRVPSFAFDVAVEFYSAQIFCFIEIRFSFKALLHSMQKAEITLVTIFKDPQEVVSLVSCPVLLLFSNKTILCSLIRINFFRWHENSLAFIHNHKSILSQDLVQSMNGG